MTGPGSLMTPFGRVKITLQADTTVNIEGAHYFFHLFNSSARELLPQK